MTVADTCVSGRRRWRSPTAFNMASAKKMTQQEDTAQRTALTIKNVRVIGGGTGRRVKREHFRQAGTRLRGMVTPDESRRLQNGHLPEQALRARQRPGHMAGAIAAHYRYNVADSRLVTGLRGRGI